MALTMWLTVFLRADLWPNLPVVLSFAGARYAVAAIVPTMALLVLGLLFWIPPRAHRLALGVLVLGLWLVTIHVVLRSQIPFYECLLQTGATAGCLQ